MDISSLWYILWIYVQSQLLFLAITVSTDYLHFLLHRFKYSKFALLHKIAQFHDYHHQFLDRTLRIDHTLEKKNLRYHAIPEYVVQISITPLFFLVINPHVVALTLLTQLIILGIVVSQKGIDKNHDVTKTDFDDSMFFVKPFYHLMHHKHPDQFFGSWLKLLDQIMGTACPIKGRKIVMTGSNGAFGKALKEKLEKLGANDIQCLVYGTDYDTEVSEQAVTKMQERDLLILCHGSKNDTMNANYHSYVALIEKFRAVNPAENSIPEIWALGSEIEIHSTMFMEHMIPYSNSKRAYAKYAATLYRDARLQYRHIVPAAFRSAMGGGLISASTAAAIALFFIRRGFNYVPVTYTGFALLNFLKFRFLSASVAEFNDTRA